MKIEPQDTIQLVMHYGIIPVGAKAIYKDQEWIVAPVTLAIAELIPEGHIPLIPILPKVLCSDLDVLRMKNVEDHKPYRKVAENLEREYRNILLHIRLLEFHSFTWAKIGEVWTQFGGDDQIWLDYIEKREKMTGLSHTGC